MITEGQIMDISRDAIFTVILTAAPLLLVSLVVGLIVSIFQTVTSIQEQTLTFVPKLIGIFITLLLCGGWIMNTCVEFLTDLCNHFAAYVGG